MPQVSSYGFSHVGRKRKAVVITSLPAYCQYTTPPVDVIKFQRDHLACSQPQAGQQKKHRAITSTDGGVPIASIDNPFDLFGLEVPRHLSEPPCRYSRNGPCEVTLGLSVPDEKPEKRAEGRHHQFGCSRTARTGVAQ